MSIRISIYEDNTAFRESLSYLIKGTESFELCGAYADPVMILENCVVEKPDVILMDIDMPGRNGIEATAIVKNAYPDINILIVTIFENKEKVFEALRAGATGYILKKSSAVDIINSITQLYNGGSPMTGEIARKVLDFFSAKTQKEIYNLSEREADILRRLTEGDSYKMIAAYCNISIGTVFTHINNIYRKLQVNSKSEAIIKAMKERLI